MRSMPGSPRCRILQILTANPEEEVKVFLQPWQLMPLVLAGRVNRQQQGDLIDYFLTENRVLRQKLGRGRILLGDEQRRRLQQVVV
jgi:hypothetical protein